MAAVPDDASDYWLLMYEDSRREEGDLTKLHQIDASEHSLSEYSEPWLLMYQRDRTNLHQIATKSPHHYDIGNIPSLVGKEIRYVYYEWMVLEDVDSPDDCCLLNLISQERIQLPPVSFEYNLFILTSHPTDPVCRVVLYDPYNIALMFCRPADDKFVRQKTGSRCSGSFTIAAGKIYFKSYFGYDMIYIGFEDSTCCIRKLKLKMRCYTYPVGNGGAILRCYLGYFSGDIFLVLRYFYNENHNKNATSFQVFKADFSDGRWVAVKSITPLTIFLPYKLNGMFHMCCPTIDSGIMSNTIYFLEENDLDYYAYRLDEESITMYPIDYVPNDKTVFRSWMPLPQETHLLQRAHTEEEVGRQDWEGTLEECESLTEYESWASLPQNS